MKIEYRTPTGLGPYLILADEGDTGAGNLQARISGYQPSFTKSPQVTPMFQAASKQVADVGNLEWMLKFTVDRVHASITAARQFLSDQGVLFAGVANVDLKITDGAVMQMFGCALTSYEPEPASDQSTLIRYTFVGPTFTHT